MSKHSLKILKYVLLAISFAVMMFPFYWLIITSVKTPMEIHASPLTYFPQLPTLENYFEAFGKTQFHIYIKNSLIVTLTSSAFILFASICGGYALARYHFRGKGIMMITLLASQMIPLITAIIPMFVLFSKWHLIDSLWSLILSYTAANIPFCLITMSSFFKAIPPTLEEAAQIDGCTRLGAAMRVVIPITAPGIFSVFVFAFTGCWNEMFYSVMMINSDSKRTIAVGLMNFVQKTNIDWGQMCAAATITLIPVAIMFFCAQKYIVAGLTSGAVKG